MIRTSAETSAIIGNRFFDLFKVGLTDALV